MRSTSVARIRAVCSQRPGQVRLTDGLRELVLKDHQSELEVSGFTVPGKATVISEGYLPACSRCCVPRATT
jgi:hypothetical protein